MCYNMLKFCQNWTCYLVGSNSEDEDKNDTVNYNSDLLLGLNCHTYISGHLHFHKYVIKTSIQLKWSFV